MRRRKPRLDVRLSLRQVELSAWLGRLIHWRRRHGIHPVGWRGPIGHVARLWIGIPWVDAGELSFTHHPLY